MAKTIHVESSFTIDAKAEELYAVVADYRVGHPSIVPKPQFGEIVIEKGGYGAGTLINATFTAYGKVHLFRHTVSEPEPGRIMRETDIESGQYTNFIFEPLNGGKQTRVTIASEYPVRAGIGGIIEGMMIPSLMRPLYAKELRNLAEYVRANHAVVTAS